MDHKHVPSPAGDDYQGPPIEIEKIDSITFEGPYDSLEEKFQIRIRFRDRHGALREFVLQPSDIIYWQQPLQQIVDGIQNHNGGKYREAIQKNYEEKYPPEKEQGQKKIYEHPKE